MKNKIAADKQIPLMMMMVIKHLLTFSEVIFVIIIGEYTVNDYESSIVTKYYLFALRKWTQTVTVDLYSGGSRFKHRPRYQSC
jgi:hypothetical protein